MSSVKFRGRNYSFFRDITIDAENINIKVELLIQEDYPGMSSTILKKNYFDPKWKPKKPMSNK